MNWKTEPVLDLEFLSQYRALGESKGVLLAKQIIERFLLNIPGRMESLQNSIEKVDFDQVIYLAHAIKSSSGGIGATRVREISSLMERCGMRAETESMRELFQHLETEILEVKKALTVYLSGLQKQRSG